jgi:hypothetical protein
LDQAEIIKLAAAVTSGGAAGAIITAVATSYRNRIQPVRYQVKTVPVFAQAPKYSGVETGVILKQNGNEYSLPNLHLTEIRLVNAGNQNLKTFTLGVTMGDKDLIVSATSEAPDRHHNAKLVNDVSAADPKQGVDFSITPFNRRDLYLLRILSTSISSAEPGEVKLSSDEAVRFVKPVNLSEVSISLTSPAAAEVIKILFR